jgi:hypothetical protein
MKSNIFPVSTLLAAVVASVILPVSAPAAVLAFTVTGLLSVFVADYGRTIKPLSLPGEIIPLDSRGPTLAELSKAA